MEPSADALRRLVYMRLLLGRAEEQARLSPPFSSDSINRLHDIAEMFLALAAQANHVKIPKTFLGYWDALEKGSGRRPLYEAQMAKLNKVRVALKHFGAQPHTNEIQASLAAVRGLLSDECPRLLGVVFEEVSLRDLVTNERARRLLERAERNWRSSRDTECFADLYQAFTEIVWDYKTRKRLSNNRSVFDSTLAMGFSIPAWDNLGRDLTRFKDDVVASLGRLDFTVSLIAIGVDLRRYGKFSSLVPYVTRLGGEKRNVREKHTIARTEADYEFCVDFVVTTAVHLSEFDYDFDHGGPLTMRVADP